VTIEAPTASRSGAIHYRDGSTAFEGYLALPDVQRAPRPCVLLAHDWSGLHEGMRHIADRVAALGYVCFAMDLYGRDVRGDPASDNSHLMNPLLADRALLRRRLLAALTAAVDHPLIDGGRIAAMGYCFGGLCALDLARAAPPELLAAVSFHGVLKPPQIGPQVPMTAKVLVLHGWDDPMAPPPDVLALAQELTAAGADWQLHAYGHCLHAFTFPGVNAPERGLAYDAAADRRSWAAMKAFFAEVLGEPATA
jgi:dienelactone hydrolase